MAGKKGMRRANSVLRAMRHVLDRPESEDRTDLQKMYRTMKIVEPEKFLAAHRAEEAKQKELSARLKVAEAENRQEALGGASSAEDPSLEKVAQEMGEEWQLCLQWYREYREKHPC